MFVLHSTMNGFVSLHLFVFNVCVLLGYVGESSKFECWSLTLDFHVTRSNVHLMIWWCVGSLVAEPIVVVFTIFHAVALKFAFLLSLVSSFRFLNNASGFYGIGAATCGLPTRVHIRAKAATFFLQYLSSVVPLRNFRWCCCTIMISLFCLEDEQLVKEFGYLEPKSLLLVVFLFRVPNLH